MDSQTQLARQILQRDLPQPSELDQGSYPTGVAVADEELAAVNLKRADFHGDWNYAIRPKRKKIVRLFWRDS